MRSGEHVRELHAGALETTNNRMELDRGDRGAGRRQAAQPYRDSHRLAVREARITEWIAQWKLRGWKRPTASR